MWLTTDLFHYRCCFSARSGEASNLTAAVTRSGRRIFVYWRQGRCRHQITKCLRFKMLFARKFRRLSFEMLLHLSSPYERTKRMWDKKNTTNQGPSRSQAANSGHSFVVEAESGTHLSICRSQVLGANDRVVMVPLALLRWISENTENWKKNGWTSKHITTYRKKTAKLS